MRIRRKLFVGLLGIPVIFGTVAIFLVVANRQVQRDSRALATIHTKLGMGAAKLSAALITGQKAAEELMAEKQRLLLEPDDKDEAEQGAGKALETIRESQAKIDEILASLTADTEHSLDDARKLGKAEDVVDGTEGLKQLALIGTEARDYNLRMEEFLTAINAKLFEADEILNDEVEQEYEQRLLPLVQNYAAARDEEVIKQASKIEQSVGRVSWLVAGSAIGAVLLAMLIAVLLSRSFSQPLTKLAAAADEIGKGRLGANIQIKSNDEIGLLARAFNRMADDLSRTTVSKDYVDEIIKSMGDSLVVASSDGFIATVNTATCRMLGYSETELIGQPVQMLFANDESSALIGESHQDDLVSNLESVYLAKDGRVIPVAFSRTSMRLSPGEAPAVVCVAKDITELKRATEKMLKEISDRTRAEEELRLQKVLLESQNEASLDGVLVISAEGEIISINLRFIEMWGIADEVLATRSGTAALKTIAGKLDHPGDLLNDARHHSDEISNKEITLQDGRVLHYYSAPVKNSDDVFYGRASYFRDITERKQLENTLRQERIFLRTLIDNIPDSIYVKDMAGRKVIANSAEVRISGVESEAELLGKNDFDLHPKELAEKFFLDDQVVLETGQPVVNREEYVLNKHGLKVWLLTTKIPLHDANGKIVGLIGLGRDITDRKGLESQLRQAQKLESVGQLAAGIAHEINTPTQYVGDNLRFIQEADQARTQVMQKYGELFKSAELGSISAALLEEVRRAIKEADLEYVSVEVPKALKQSLEGVERIAKIVQSMKDFAHPGSTEKKAVDLNRAIESTINVARGEWKYVAEMEMDFDLSLPPVPCLLGELNQMTLNMIINSSHAIADKMKLEGQGKGLIKISTRHEGDWAEMRISDTGGGIPVANQARVFDPFFTTKEVGKGTGQGLAISHAVVEKHGGTIAFETAEGEGTTFIIRLPLHQIAETPDGLMKEAA